MKYAIIESGGKQFKAVEGLTIDVDRLSVESGATIKLEQVLLLADGENVTVGTPFIKDFIVWAKALDHVKGPKVTVFKYRPKKRIRVKAGHRQSYTRLMIEQIGGSSLAPKKKVEEPKPEETVAVEAEAKAPAKKVAEKPAAKKAVEKPAAKAAPKKASEKPAAKAAPKKASEKPAAKAAPKKASEKPAAKKSGEKAAPKKAAPKKAAEKPAEKKSTKPAEKKADK